MKICPACARECSDEHARCPDDGVVLVHLDTAPNARGEDLIGQVVDGRYRIERVVGRGGMGTVYACRHVVVGKAFAMKVLRPGIERSEEILQRFIREAQAANAVASRHICEMSDFGQLPNGAFYVVMELLEGMSLTRALREKRLDRPAIKRIFIQIADTLQQAHSAGIIHRDLKPDNVVLVHEGSEPFFVKLVDFGIAKMTQHQASSLTETGVILGTPYYMSPEQARGEPLDHRSDIYALGVMMYRAFTGRLPFVADTAMGVLTRHLTEKPELPSRLAEVDGAVERLILRCLEKKAIDRFQSMSDLAEALRSVPDHPKQRAGSATIDERSGGLRLPRLDTPSEESHPTPTRVTTPRGRALTSGAYAGHMSGPHPDAHAAWQRSGPHAGHPTGPSLPPGGALHAGQLTPDARPTRPDHGHSSMPPPMPAPPPPSEPTRVAPPQDDPRVNVPAVAEHPAHISGTHPPQTSGAHPALNATPPSGAYMQLQGEPTGRAVVSSRIASPRPRKPRNTALLGGAAALGVSVLVIGAIAVLSSGGAPAPATGASSEPSASIAGETDGDEVPDATGETAEDPGDGDGETTTETEDEVEVTAATSASASAKPAVATSTPAPRPRPQPKAEPKTEPEPEDDDIDEPMPEIRSPFD